MNWYVVRVLLHYSYILWVNQNIYGTDLILHSIFLYKYKPKKKLVRVNFSPAVETQQIVECK